MQKDKFEFNMQIVTAGLLSFALNIAIRYNVPEIFTGDILFNAIMSGMGGMFFMALFVYLKTAMGLRRTARNLTAADSTATTEAPKVIEAPVEVPVVAATTEATEGIPVEKKEEPVIPTGRTIILKKKTPKQ